MAVSGVVSVGFAPSNVPFRRWMTTYLANSEEKNSIRPLPPLGGGVPSIDHCNDSARHRYY